MKYKSVALLFVIQLLQFPSFSYIKLISFRSEVNTLYASQIHIFHSNFLFQIYQDFFFFSVLVHLQVPLQEKSYRTTLPDRLLLLPKFQLGTQFQEEGKRPVGNATIEELAQYNAFFAEDTEEKKIYLTFDAGFENGNTPAILDALKKHQAPATFFVVGNFISENKDLIKRMETEGILSAIIL